jgi:hypothetical protein
MRLFPPQIIAQMGRGYNKNPVKKGFAPGAAAFFEKWRKRLFETGIMQYNSFTVTRR